jgi:hypothetical protein
MPLLELDRDELLPELDELLDCPELRLDAPDPLPIEELDELDEELRDLAQ